MWHLEQSRDLGTRAGKYNLSCTWLLKVARGGRHEAKSSMATSTLNLVLFRWNPQTANSERQTALSDIRDWASVCLFASGFNPCFFPLPDQQLTHLVGFGRNVEERLPILSQFSCGNRQLGLHMGCESVNSGFSSKGKHVIVVVFEFFGLASCICL